MKKITLLAMSFIMALTVKAQYGTDVTELLTNPDFESGTEGWTITGGGWSQATAASYGYNGTSFLENWTASTGNLADLDWSQTIEVPNGFYVVKSLAHSIKQSDESLVAKGVTIYANNDEVAVTTNTTNPPTEYIVTTVVADGNLAIGYRIKSGNVNWTAWDNIRVYQYLAATTDEAKFQWVKDEMDQLAKEFENLLDYSMSQALKDAINESIEAMEEVSTYAEADALWSTMKQQMADANACIDAYEKLNLKVDETYEFADQEGADDLYDLLDEIAAKAEEGEYDTAGALAEIEAIGQAVYEFNLSNADGSVGFDVTERFVTNPTLRQNSNGWEGSKPGLEHEVMEFYNSDFDIYQQLTDVPNGKYVVKVQGFYREAGNDSGAAYSAGTENITAKLYANSVSQPLVSLYKYTASEMGVTADVLNDYVNMRYSTNMAFSTQNSLTGKNYYRDNEVTVIVTDGNLKIGLSNVGHKGSSWCAFRDFELWYYGNFPAVNLYGKMEDIKAYLNTNVTEVPYAVSVEVSNYMNSIKDYAVEGKYEDEEVNTVILALDSVWAEAEKAIALFAEVKALAERIEDELLPLDYPGKGELNKVLEGMAPYLAETSTVNTYAGMQVLVAEVTEAIANYYFSQVATPEIAADYTFLLPNPNFENKGNWTWSVVGGGTDQWNGGCRPSEEGGANRQGVNLWGWGITSVDVHQVLTGLPDGLYKVSAEMITQNNFATDQHVYAASASKATSNALTVTGWDTYEWTELVTNDFAVVVGGRLSVGAASFTGGTNSEGWFQATNFQLYYHGPASAEQLKAAWEDTEARANEALEILIPNEKKELASVMEEATPLAAEGKYSDACALVIPVVMDLDSTITATKNFYGGYYARLDTLRQREGYETCDSTHAFVDIVLAMVDEVLASDTATCKIFDGLASQVYEYYNYASSLRDAEYLINNDSTYLEQYRSYVADSVVRPQVKVLLGKLCDVETCQEKKAILDEANGILKATANMSKEINVGDVTYLLVNPTVEVVDGEALAGWTVLKNNAQNCGTNSNEHYAGVTNAYLDAWHPNAGTMNATFYQELLGIPDGIYKLTVAARTDGNNAQIFAEVNDSVTNFMEVKNYGAWRGEIWEADSLAWGEAGCPEENLAENFPYFMARPDSTGYGVGFGWSWHVIENIEVTNHFLSIGLTADNALSGVNFGGTWMGADDWKLELIEISEVQSEFNPFADFNKGTEEEEEEEPGDDAVDKIEVAPVFMGIYDLFGRRIDAITAPGLYIVNGKKVLVK